MKVRDYMNYFEKNLKVLEKRQPELVGLMRKEMDTSHIKILTATSGIPTAKVIGPDGKHVLLHDVKDPVVQAQDHVKKFDLSSNTGSVLLGFGLGYLAREMVTSMDDGHVLIICEADPALFKVALEHVALEHVLKSDRVKILVGKDIDIQGAITAIAIKFLSAKVSVVKFNPSYALDPETYALWEKNAKDTSHTLKISANTIILAGREMAGNILANTPRIMHSSGVKNIFNKFTNVPAIVVGAGPSLDKNVTLLKEVNDRAVIIAVDRALGLLLPLGITPHLVPSIDYSKINYEEKYAPLLMEEKLFMVSSQTLYHKITKSFWGPVFSLNQRGQLSDTLSYYWGDKGNVTAGLHVGHLAFCLARAIGCNPIILTGMDLAFTGDKLHAKDVKSSIGLTASANLTREDIFGNRVRTDPAFKSFVVELEREINKTDALCIDASEGGAKKEGTVIMRLKDAIDEYCTNDLPDIRTTLEQESQHREEVKYDELIDDLKNALTTSKEMKHTAESTLKLIKKLKRMKQDGQEGTPHYSSLSRKAEKLTSQIGAEGRIIEMLEHYNFSNLLFMGKNTTQRIDEIQDPFDKLARQLDRAETYYSTLMKALNPFAQDVQELLKRLTVTQTAEIHLAQSEKTWNDYLTYAASLITSENYSDAEAALQKALDLNPDSSDVYYHLGQIYYEQNRFKSATVALNQAQALSSNSNKTKNLLKKCQERNQHWHERGEEIRKRFLANDPSDTGNEKERLLEAGNFYFGVKDYTRAEKEYLNAIYENPNLSDAYYHLGHTYFAMNDFDRGVDALTSALNCSPDNPAIYRDLGLVSIDRGLVEAAEKFLLKALELKPDDLELKETLGNIYFNNGRFDKAVKMYEDILSINPAYKELTKTLGIAYQKLISKNFQSREAGVN
jgi:hypothetical protein